MPANRQPGRGRKESSTGREKRDEMQGHVVRIYKDESQWTFVAAPAPRKI